MFFARAAPPSFFWGMFFLDLLPLPQVCTFGSVPLKTYLPDGDIDLTAFSQDHNLKDTWANQVRDMLQNEEKNEHAEFRVKEVQYIQAEVSHLLYLKFSVLIFFLSLFSVFSALSCCECRICFSSGSGWTFDTLALYP